MMDGTLFQTLLLSFSSAIAEKGSVSLAHQQRRSLYPASRQLLLCGSSHA